MSSPKQPSETNITLRVDADVLLWARVRAVAGTSVNGLVRDLLREYAAVPERFLQGRPWSDGRRAVDTFRQVIDPMGAGLELARTGAGGVSEGQRDCQSLQCGCAAVRHSRTETPDGARAECRVPRLDSDATLLW